MTDPSFTSTIHPPATPPKRKGWRIRHIAAAYALGGIILGLVAGGAMAEPKQVEVIKEVPGPERVVTKTEKVDVPFTPAACVTALELNEQAFSGLAESMRLVTEGDYAGAKANTDKVGLLVPKVNAAKSECRASAK